MSEEDDTSLEKLNDKPATTMLYLDQPVGHLSGATMICGFAAALVAIVLDMVDAYAVLIHSVQRLYQAEPFHLYQNTLWHRSLDWILSIIGSLITAFAILDSAGKGKRVMLGCLALVLIVMCSPVLMLWGVFWVPISLFIAVALAWVFTFLYSCLHIMPCELDKRSQSNKKTKTPQPSMTVADTSIEHTKE